MPAHHDCNRQSKRLKQQNIAQHVTPISVLSKDTTRYQPDVQPDWCWSHATDPRVGRVHNENKTAPFINTGVSLHKPLYTLVSLNAKIAR